jgi:tetratricopeptide (TPR) repeat protein
MTLLSNPDMPVSIPLAKPLECARWHLGRLLPVLCLLAIATFGATFLGRHLWAVHHWRAAQTALTQHNFVQAQAHLQCCLEVRHDPETIFLVARTARRAGDYDEVVRRLSECERLQGRTPAVALEHLLLRAQYGDLTPDVEGQLWSLVQQNHWDGILILEAMTQGYIYTYRLRSGLACLERWLQQQPDSIQALLWRAQVCQSLQSYDEALNNYCRAVALDPAHDHARLQLAVFLAFSGRADQAVEHFERLRQRQPHNPQVLLGLARCRHAQGRTGEADQLLDELLRQNPQDIPALRERGKNALHAGREAEAEDWLQKCLALDRHDQEATYLLALCLERRGKNEEARMYWTRLERIDADLKRLEALNRAIGQAPDDADLRQEAAIICLRNGQEQEALRWWAGALQVNPQSQPTHQDLAEN